MIYKLLGAQTPALDQLRLPPMQIGQTQKIASSVSPFLAKNVGLSVIIRTLLYSISGIAAF